MKDNMAVSKQQKMHVAGGLLVSIWSTVQQCCALLWPYCQRKWSVNAGSL